MPKTTWGAPSFSDDIRNNLSKTHHKEIFYTNSFKDDYINSVKASLRGEDYERPYEERLVRNNNIDHVSQFSPDEIHYEMNEEKRLNGDFNFDDYEENTNSDLFIDFSDSDSNNDSFDSDPFMDYTEI